MRAGEARAADPSLGGPEIICPVKLNPVPPRAPPRAPPRDPPGRGAFRNRALIALLLALAAGWLTGEGGGRVRVGSVTKVKVGNIVRQRIGRRWGVATHTRTHAHRRQLETRDTNAPSCWAWERRSRRLRQACDMGPLSAHIWRSAASSAASAFQPSLVGDSASVSSIVAAGRTRTALALAAGGDPGGGSSSIWVGGMPAMELKKLIVDAQPRDSRVAAQYKG